MKNFLLVLTSLFLVIGCGGSDKKSDYAPLNTDQKTQFSTTLKDAGNSLGAYQRKQQTAQAPQTPTLKAADFAGLDPQAKYLVDHPGNCTFNPGAKSSITYGSGANFPTFDMDLSGDQCPYTETFHMDASGSSTSLDMNLSLKLVVNDPAYKTLSDIYGISLSGSGGIHANGTGTASADFSFKGELDSNKFGVMPLSITLNGSGTRDHFDATGAVVLTYPTFTAELKVISTGDGKGQSSTNYYLNGEEISLQQANAYFENVKQGMPNSSPTSNPFPYFFN